MLKRINTNFAVCILWAFFYTLKCLSAFDSIANVGFSSAENPSRFVCCFLLCSAMPLAHAAPLFPSAMPPQLKCVSFLTSKLLLAQVYKSMYFYTVCVRGTWSLVISTFIHKKLHLLLGINLSISCPLNCC